jgi:hypothetical protein
VVKDEAFERAMNGELIPVFVAGKLMGFRRKKNDRLLMFILRHYGQDAAGRRTTVNYFSTRATAGAAASSPSPLVGASGRPSPGRAEDGRGPSSPDAGWGGGSGSAAAGAVAKAEATTTTVKTIISGNPGQSTTLARTDEAAALLNAFTGAELDEAAKAEIYRSLEACAERRRALQAAPEDDPNRFYIGAGERGHFLGTLEIGAEEDLLAFRSGAGQGRIGEHRWTSLGEGGDAAEIDEAVASVQAAIAASTPEQREADRAAARAEIEHEAPRLRQSARKAALPLSRDAEAPDGLRPRATGPTSRSRLRDGPSTSPDPDDPRLDWRNWETGSYNPPSNPPLHSEGRGTADAAVEGSLLEPYPNTKSPTPKTMRSYKPRTPKPPFTPPDAESEARAREAVAADRRIAAEDQAARRARRR